MHKIRFVILLLFTCSINYGQGFEKVKSKSKHSHKINNIVCNDSYFATSSYDNSLILWDYKGKILFKHKVPDGKINSMCFTPDSNLLLVGITEKENRKKSRFVIKSFDIDGNEKFEFINKELTQDYVNEYYKVNTVSEQNAIAAIQSTFPTLNSKKELDVPQVEKGLSHFELVQHIAVSPKGQTVASIDKFNILNIWNEDGFLINSIQIDNKKKETQISFLSEFELFITPNIFLNINNLNTELIDGFEMHSSICFGNKIYFFFDYNDNSRLEKLYNLESSTIQEMNTKQFYTLEASSSNTKLSLLGVDGLIRVINEDSELLSTFGKERTEIIKFRGEKFQLFSKICKIGFSPNGQHIVSGDVNGKVIIWKSQLN